ncbi:MAG: hypothetical protein D6689_20940, partial [Deltaproteobacteria bacterium]
MVDARWLVARSLGFVPFAVAAVTAACSGKDPQFCCTDSQSCAAGGSDVIVECTDPERPYCDVTGEYGGTGNTCIPNPFDAGTKGDAGGADGMADGGGPDGMVDAGPECMTSAECAEAAEPICDDGTCRACGVDTECEARGGGTPACAPDGRCVPCVRDDQCGSEVCEEEAEMCADEGGIVYVDAATGNDGGGCGTRDNPCKTIGAGLGKVTAMRSTVVVRAGGYDETILLDGVDVRIIGSASGTTEIVAPALATDTPVVQVLRGANVTLERVTLRGASGSSAAHGLLCSAAGGAPTVRLTRVTIKSNDGAGISSSGCTLTVQGSDVT